MVTLIELRLVFGPLKTAYRDQVERLHRGGSNMTENSISRFFTIVLEAKHSILAILYLAGLKLDCDHSILTGY